jgi:hypothetical protein
VLGFRVRVQGSGFRVHGSGFRVDLSGLRVVARRSDDGERVLDLSLHDHPGEVHQGSGGEGGGYFRVGAAVQRTHNGYT